MKKLTIVLMALIIMAFGTSSALSADIDLAGWGFNINGTEISTDLLNVPGDLPGYFNYSGFNFASGLGTITATYNPGSTGLHHFLAFFDHEIDVADNTFFNETGAKSGTPVTGPAQIVQSWEIDEPGFVTGDIYENFLGNTLDNAIGDSVYGDTVFPDDVSMAIGWNFNLYSPSNYAILSFTVGTNNPGGFYLSQTDPDSPQTIYFSSNLQVVPEPATMMLLGVGLLGLLGLGRRRFAK